jgi:phosphoadenosine phosphosulfate reductase
MRQTLAIINYALAQQPAACVAVSGGGDSGVLADLIYRELGHTHLPMIYTDTRMDYEDTPAFVTSLAAHYGVELIRAEAPREPVAQWEKAGWPMLGKMAARVWSQHHRNREMGFRCDVSSCCRAMKIAPARRAMKERGLILSYTGQRGGQDDSLRGLRAIRDGALVEVKGDGIWQCNPLLGWTDMMISRYTAAHNLPRHPARERGALTIGCLYCGGGAQFDNSGYRALRQTNPEAWWQFMVEWGGAEIITAVKYDITREQARAALAAAGGLEYLARERPWVFDFLRATPLAGYQR